MSILKLLFALNPKNLKVVKASEMTLKMAQEIDSFLGKMGAVTSIGKYKLTPSQIKYWKTQRNELTKFENKYNEMAGKNKISQKGIESLKNKPSAEIIYLGKAPKTDLKKVRDKVKKDKDNLQDLKDQIPTKDIDDDLDFANGGLATMFMER